MGKVIVVAEAHGDPAPLRRASARENSGPLQKSSVATLEAHAM